MTQESLLKKVFSFARATLLTRRFFVSAVILAGSLGLVVELNRYDRVGIGITSSGGTSLRLAGGWPLRWIAGTRSETNGNGTTSINWEEINERNWGYLAVDIVAGLVMVITPLLLAKHFVKNRFQFSLRELFLAMIAFSLILAFWRFENSTENLVRAIISDSIYSPLITYPDYHHYHDFLQWFVSIDMWAALFLAMQWGTGILGKTFRKKIPGAEG